MERNDYYVYVYCDPRKNNLPFYAGKGSIDRITNHLTETLEKTPNKRKFYKIESIRNSGLEPYIFKYAENLTNDQAYDLEDFLITVWGRKDFDENGILFNILEAGRRSPSISGPDHYNWGKPGAMLGKHLTKEQIEKVRLSKQGKKRKPFNQEWLDKLAESNRGENNGMYGRKQTLESRKLMSIKATGRIQSQETIDKKIETYLEKVRERYKKIIPKITEIQESGITTYRGIARELNNCGFKTDRNCNFNGDIVKRILGYIKEIENEKI